MNLFWEDQTDRAGTCSSIYSIPVSTTPVSHGIIAPRLPDGNVDFSFFPLAAQEGYVQSILSDLKAKLAAGFPVTINDYWSRALSHHFLPGRSNLRFIPTPQIFYVGFLTLAFTLVLRRHDGRQLLQQRHL